MIKNKWLVISIILLSIINLFLVFKKDTSIVEKSKINKIERKEFSILKEQTYNGEDWKESNDTTFPTSGYLLNETQSKCYGYDNDPITPIPVKQELTKGSIDGRVTIESSKTIYCELYFDIDNKVPEVNTFSITGKTSSGDTLNNGYTYQTDNIPYTLTYEDTDVTQYCINNTIECTEWKEIKEKTNTLTIEATDGEKTMYIYLKDTANNVSVITDKSTAKITVDQTKPSVTLTLTGAADEGQTLSDSSQYTHTNNITYNASITESNIDSYCVYEDSCSYQPTTSTSFNKVNYTLNDTEGSHSVKIRVKDKAGNESDVSTQSITLDKTNPVATIKENSVTTESITVTIGYEGQDSIMQRQCRIDSPTVGEWKDTEPDGSCTISSLDDGTQYTIEGRVRDTSGRWNTDYPSVSVETESAGFRGTGKQLIGYHPKGLTATDLNGMKRFAGRCSTWDDKCLEVVDNFVCFGYTDISQCKGDVKDNDYIYRIIGINSNGEMKLIRNNPLTSRYLWDDSEDSGVSWGSNSLYSNLVGEGFWLGLPVVWQGKIKSSVWLNAGLDPDSYTGRVDPSDILRLEMESASGFVGPIGLQTVSDVLYSCGDTTCPFKGYDWHTWLTISDADWLMTQVKTEYWSMGMVASGGTRVMGYSGTESGVARPVFYLYSSTLISSGSGSFTDPFIIAK